jgi:DNA polymerase-3 subunit delta'
MSLLPLVGHESARADVLRSLREGRLPQMLLLTGAPGIGKQRFALWLAAALLCEGEGERPCGRCRSCLQVAGLAHPDLHWMMPVPRPKAGEPDKQVEELADTIAQVIEERRKEPLWGPAEGLAGHFVATARLLQRRAALTPVQGKRKVFILAEADRLVPQESSPEAANALLKLLEEPPADSTFLLTVADPNRLLPTVRSRLVPLRLGRLPDRVVEEFLAIHAGVSGAALGRMVAAAEGSIGRALAAGEEQAKAAKAVEELLKAVTAGPAARAERALKQGPWAARGDFTAMLDALAESLADAARQAASGRSKRPLPEPLTRPRPVEALVAAQEKVARAREAAQGNVNPQLLLMALADDLAEVL